MAPKVSVSTEEVKDRLKFDLVPGKATPAPPVATALGPRGINLMEFCKKFNDETKDRKEDILRVKLLVYKNKTFSFTVHPPSVSHLIKKALNLKIASKEPGRSVVAYLTKSQVRDIAALKIGDTNADSLEKTESMVMGTARSMGIEVVDD
jgi:large subunit ribosomal protein L11